VQKTLALEFCRLACDTVSADDLPDSLFFHKLLLMFAILGRCRRARCLPHLGFVLQDQAIFFVIGVEEALGRATRRRGMHSLRIHV
jgi:hypothetical protein